LVLSSKGREEMEGKNLTPPHPCPLPRSGEGRRKRRDERNSNNVERKKILGLIMVKVNFCF
jgi:hypothetical protein